LIEDLLKKEFVLSIVASIVAAILLIFINFLFKKIANYIFSKNPIFYYPYGYTLSYLIVAFFLLVFYYRNLEEKIISNETIYISISIVTLFYVSLLLMLLWKYKKIGIYGVDTSIKTGTDYNKALRTVKTEFKFLGVGGNKLTNNYEEFKLAVNRAGVEGKHVRLLLCDPKSEALEIIAKKAGKKGREVKEYSSNVKKSLSILAELKDSGHKIDVKFYNAKSEDDMPIFRLMFFNSKYCLASYTVFGVKGHKGEQLPQLHLTSSDPDHVVNSFYFAFDRVFERLWSNKETVDWSYKEFLSEEG